MRAWRHAPALVVALACLLAPAAASAVPNDTRVSSRTSGEGAPNGSSDARGESGANGQWQNGGPSISANGRHVAFTSYSPNLTTDDTNSRGDVFVRDHETAVTRLISRASDIGGAGGTPGDGYSWASSISPDGRYVVFTSSAGNLAPGDVSGALAAEDVFVRDRDPDGNGVFDEGNATTTLVSRASGDGPPANGVSGGGTISADGRYIAFWSAAGLVPGDTNDRYDIYVRDRKGTATAADDTTEVVSRPDGDGPPAGGEFFRSVALALEPAISADGRYVAFRFSDPALAGAANPTGIFVRDLRDRTTKFLSRSDTDASPSISADGRFVAFRAPAGVVPKNATETHPQKGLFVADRRADTFTYAGSATEYIEGPGSVSTSSPPPPSMTTDPSISPGGRFVAFVSTDPLVQDDLASFDVYVRDLQEGVTRLVSRSSGVAGLPSPADEGVAGNGPSYGPAVAEGGFVAFASRATNLVVPDTNGITDVFRRELPSAPAPPSVSVGDVSVAEGDSGVVQARFRVSLSRAVGQAVVVDYATAAGSAAAGEDFLGDSGSVVVPAGETGVDISVGVRGDVLDEEDERFFVNLSGAQGASVGDGQGVGTIVDDDPPVAVSIDDVLVTEGDSGEVDASFTVSLSGVSGRAVSVDWATVDDSARSPEDFVAGGGRLSFAAGEVAKVVVVRVKGDVLDEDDEQFFVDLSAPQAATLARQRGVATIADNDEPSVAPRLSIGDVSVVEGDSGTVQANFEVSRSGSLSEAVEVGFATANASAIAPGDYAARSGTARIAAGAASTSVTVDVVGDELDEPDEDFRVNLSSPVGAEIEDGQGVGAITDDDDPPVLSVGDVSVTEGDSGDVVASLAVSLSGASGRAVGVDFATADDSAIAGSDYVARPPTRLELAPGETSKAATVLVSGDLLDEPDERFVVELSGASGAGISDGEGVVTILDNDPEPALSVDDVSVVEGDAGERDATFTLSLSAPSGREVAVTAATRDVSASAPSDYAAVSEAVSFDAGQTKRRVSVRVRGDTVPEPDERFLLDLSGQSNASFGDNQGVATITDDDAPAPRALPAPPRAGRAASGRCVRRATVRRGRGRVAARRLARLRGTALGDALIGSRGPDLLRGLGGDDCLVGKGGRDRLHGHSGNDRLKGHSGNDRVWGGRGNDRIWGHSGNDRLSGGPGNDRIAAGSGNDRINARSGRDRINAGSGNDRIDAADGKRDTINCGRGRDRVTADRKDRLRGCERRKLR